MIDAALHKESEKIKTRNKTSSGFTIVELLIVIIVIAILAAIGIASYTALQERSRTSAGLTVATGAIKKLEALGGIKGGVFTDTSGGRTGAQLNAYATSTPPATEALFQNPSSIIAAGSTASTHGMSAANSSNGQRVSVYACPAGAHVWYWDWSASQAVRLVAGNGC